MTNDLFGIMLAVLGIGLLIIVHETGHFMTAKILKVKVHEFVVGYGPKLISRKIKDTVYALAWIPFGGYVKIEDIKPEEISLEETRLPILGDLPLYKRLLILVSGSAANFIFAIVLISVIFMVGVPFVTTTIDEISKGSAAEEASLQPGDKILFLAGEKISDWPTAIEIIRANPNEVIEIEYLRDGKVSTSPVTLGERDGAGFLGVSMRLDTAKYPFATSFIMAVRTTAAYAAATLKFLYQFITSTLPDGAQVRFIGPVGFTSELSRGAKESILIYLEILAQMSVGLGIANLFIIPPLDGGKLILLGIEAAKRKPLKAKTIMMVQAAGIFLLLSMTILVTFSDLFGPGG